MNEIILKRLGALMGVQIIAVGNIENKTGYNTRMWKKWGILPYVDDKEEEVVTYEQWKQLNSLSLFLSR